MPQLLVVQPDEEEMRQAPGLRVVQDNQERVDGMKRKSVNNITDMFEKIIAKGYVVRVGLATGDRYHASAVTMRTDLENRYSEGYSINQVVEDLYSKVFQ